MNIIIVIRPGHHTQSLYAYIVIKDCYQRIAFELFHPYLVYEP